MYKYNLSMISCSSLRFMPFFFLLFMFYHQNTPFFLLVAFVFSGPFGSTKLLLSFFSFDYLLVLVDKAKNGEFHHFLFLNLSCLRLSSVYKCPTQNLFYFDLSSFCSSKHQYAHSFFQDLQTSINTLFRHVH